MRHTVTVTVTLDNPDNPAASAKFWLAKIASGLGPKPRGKQGLLRSTEGKEIGCYTVTFSNEDSEAAL